jgi:type IV secretory pathway TrbD component
MPNAPDEAFADGAKLTGSLLFGWLPAGFGCLMVWIIGHAVRRNGDRARDQATQQS